MLFYQAVLLPGMQVPGGAAQRRQAAVAGLLQRSQRCPFLLADPDDVGCSPPLHHVSQIASSLPCPGLGGGLVVYSKQCQESRLLLATSSVIQACKPLGVMSEI